MALGTALTAATTVSTTLGTHLISLNAAGVSAVQAAIDSGGKLTVFLMSNEYDYEGNDPTMGGDHTRIRVYYQEYSGTSRDPQLKVVFDDSSLGATYSIGVGNDDDGYIINANLDDSETWAEVRGDVDTVGSSRNVTLTNSYSGVYAVHVAGRGSDIIRHINRTMLVFDLSAMSGTVASSQFALYLDCIGDTGDAAKIIAVQGTALAGSNADYGNCFVADAVTVTDNATFFGANF